MLQSMNTHQQQQPQQQYNPLEDIVNFLKQTDELAVAKTLLKTFQKYSNTIEQYDQLGRLFNDVKAYPEAIDCAGKTLVMSSNPIQMYSARQNLAKMYNHINRPDLSLQYINANIALNPDDYETKMEQLFSLYLYGKKDESYAIIQKLLSDPNCPENVKNRCMFNKGSYLMDAGDYMNGMDQFITVGHEIGIWPKTEFPNTWDGGYIPNATIVVVAEGGIGDEIINIRFMKDIKERGMNPIWVSNHKLSSIFVRNGFNSVDGITGLKERLNSTENVYFCQSFSLPLLLQLYKEELDHGVYLKPDPVYVEKWEEILGEGKKVAFRWSGQQMYDQNLHRQLTLKQFMDNIDSTGLKLFSVQRDNDLEQLKDYPEVIGLHDKLETFDDLMACLSLMDMTFTSCTSVAHFAGAIGAKVTVFPPISCYYVWLGGNYWYGSNVKVIRQEKWQDWSHISGLNKLLE